MLEISHLQKAFGSKKVLNDLSFTFSQGVYGLLGPNGAGKTTLMRCITRLYPITGDAITYNGTSIRTDARYLSRIGYLPQKFGVFRDLKVTEMLQLLANLKGITRDKAEPMIMRALEQVNLLDRAGSRVGSLSGGMVRRLGVAQALLNEPELLIFDEPTAGLDPEERLRFKNIIAKVKGSATILISTHIVEDVEAVCDQVAVMQEGRIAASGTCRDIQEFARGKVYLLREEEKGKLRGSYEIQRHYEEDGVRMLKILSSVAQDAQGAAPTVEDGYVCILSNL